MQYFTGIKTSIFNLLLVAISFFLFGCGSNSSSDPAPGDAGVRVTTLAGSANISGSTDGIGSAARFANPGGITIDGVNLYVASTQNHTIRQIVIATGAVTTLAGTAGMSGSTDDAGAAARFNTPNGITSDGVNLYVADTFNHTIRQIVIATGAVTTLAGTAGMSGSADDTGAAARFFFPVSITNDGTNLYVGGDNNTIRQIVIATGAVTTLAGTAGMSGSTDDTGAAARFNLPYGLNNDGTNLYVSDSSNNTIRQIVIATGVVTTLAGTAGMTGSSDGTGVAAQFNFPRGITNDGTILYVSDASNSTIRQIDIATGVVTTLAGTAGMIGSSDGNASAARFDGPDGIINDGSNLYVSDRDNHIIRRISY